MGQRYDWVMQERKVRSVNTGTKCVILPIIKEMQLKAWTTKILFYTNQTGKAGKEGMVLAS